MADRTSPDTLNVRLPLYAYTSALWRSRRVLEIGCGDGTSAAYLAVHGAADVVSLDVDSGRIESARAQHARPGIHYLLLDSIQQIGALAHRFDVILLPEGEAVLADPGLVSRIKNLLGPDGILIVAVTASERQSPFFDGGVGYYDLSDALTRDFRAVRMLGQTPFLGFGLIEFDTGSEGLRVDVSLLGGGTEQPSHYVAIAGDVPSPPLGQALVQVPFAPVEDLAEAAARAEQGGPGSAEAEREISRLRAELDDARTARQGTVSTVELAAATTRADLAERRLEEIERRARARTDELDGRVTDLRRKLEDALVASESAVRVSRAQSDEIDELRARLRRAAEDRELADSEIAKLRRAVTEADDSVLTLTRRTAEEMAVVAQRLVTGLGSAAAAPSPTPVVAAGATAAATAELEAKLRRAEEAAARGEADVAAFAERLRAADEELRTFKRGAGDVASRDERIARLEGDKQDLLWRVAELEEKLRFAEQDAQRASAGRETPEEITIARASRDRAIEEFHRAAAAHVNEVNRLQASVSEHAALVAELEDSLRVAEARAVAADREATTLRRNAKELEEADRARRGRLSELEGKLLRLERERAMAAEAAARGEGGGPATAELQSRLQASEQRVAAAEQRAQASEEAARAAAARAAAAEEALGAAEKRAQASEESRAMAAARAASAEEALGAAERRAQAQEQAAREASARVAATEEALAVAEQRAGELADRLRLLEHRAAEADETAAAALLRATMAEERAAVIDPRAVPFGAGHGNGAGNGTHRGDLPAVEVRQMRSAIEDAEARLRDEVRTLGKIEATLERAEALTARAPAFDDRAELERALVGKDAQLVEGRLELARVRRESESTRLQLENQIADLRTRLSARSGESGGEQGMNAQLVLMHSTLANIRRRAARLRDELEGFRRRLDTLPPGALASMLEEIGEDLGEFAK
ncbi:MAG TPA: methyltransferase domain-containing protein [Polyangia bacterium]